MLQNKINWYVTRKKITTNEEAMIEGLRSTAQSRADLRSKHLTQLEEKKAALNQIRSRQLLNESVDFEFPKNDYVNNQKTTSEKAKFAEAILTRIASAKIKDAA